MTETTDQHDGTVEHHVRVTVDLTARGFDTSTAAEVAAGARGLIADALEAYEPVQPGIDLWAPTDHHPEGAGVGKLDRIHRVDGRPTDGPDESTTELLRGYCREFAIPTEDQPAHVDYLTGLLIDVLADRDTGATS